MRTRRLAAYGVAIDRAGRVLLVRAGARSSRPGTWCLPGGGLAAGEDPAAAVVREVREECGLAAAVTGLRDVATEVVDRPSGPDHIDGVVYDLAVSGGPPRAERGGSSDGARWLPAAEAATLPLTAFAAGAVGRPEPEPEPPGGAPYHTVAFGGAAQRQRLRVSGVVRDGSGRVWLERCDDQWDLPTSGVGFGEQPRDALRRALSGRSRPVGAVGPPLAVVHRRAAGGWHEVVAVFAVAVPEAEPAGAAAGGGPGRRAGWFTPREVVALPLTPLARDGLHAGAAAGSRRARGPDAARERR